MVTEKQVRILMKAIETEGTLANAAAKAGMDEKTARKYRDLCGARVDVAHTWRTREDPFLDVWDEVREKLEVNPGLEAKTLFEDLQRRYAGRFSDGQLRSLQRRVKIWRAVEGPAREVFFPQAHRAGELCQSDFTHMGELGVTIQRAPFDHLYYHFVLSYSNWEAGTVCFSESFESLSEGLQNALWALGAVPRYHRTDRLSTAVLKQDRLEEFTERYRALLRHYGMEGLRIQASQPHENGDIEQRHHRFKRALDQALMLRGSRDFESRRDYERFVERLFSQLNSGRNVRLGEELKVMGQLPSSRLEACKRIRVRVGPSSTIRVAHNVYSVDSRLIGEVVEVRLYVEHLEIWYAQRRVESIPRLRGAGRHRVNFRHIIDWLMRKPGAFENFRYREDLFPTHRFRMAYDALRGRSPSSAAREYLKVLNLAAKEGETRVDDALRWLEAQDFPVTADALEAFLASGCPGIPATEVLITPVDLASYDTLLEVGYGSN